MLIAKRKRRIAIPPIFMIIFFENVHAIHAPTRINGKGKRNEK